MSKKISVTISDELYDIISDSLLLWENSISAGIRGILEHKYRDSLRDDEATITLETRQDYFRHHLLMLAIRSIINNTEQDANNIFVKLNKYELKKQYDISEIEEDNFFTTVTTSIFYDRGKFGSYCAFDYISINNDDVDCHLYSGYVNAVREFLQTGNLSSAIFKH